MTSYSKFETFKKKESMLRMLKMIKNSRLVHGQYGLNHGKFFFINRTWLMSLKNILIAFLQFVIY